MGNIILVEDIEKLEKAITDYTLCGADWVEGIYTTRFYGFLDYANMVVFTVLFFYPLALKRINKNKIVKLLITIM